MVNERYDSSHNDEHHEEGEYHFSDDQVNYEMDPESVNSGTVVAAAPKANVMDKLKQNRRIMIGVIVFFILMGLVYKLLVPAPTTPPSTDINQQALPTSAATPPVTTTTKTVTKVAEHPVIPVQSPPPAAPAVQPTEQQSPAPVASVAPAPQQPAVAQQSVAPVASAPATPMNPPAQPPAVTVQASPPSVPVSAAPASVDTSAQDNAAMNLLQTEYSQKMAENEKQVSDMKTQIQELNSRVAGMEVSFHQLTKILRSMRSDSSNSSNNMAADTNGDNSAAQQPARVIQPSRVHYTVQAIIPGRAWLKSDSGDTVTVAEGDELKDVGRITKIDPYDGIVNIDTGNKIITLSYGVTGE